MNKLKKLLPVILALSLTGSIYFSFQISPDHIVVKKYTIEETTIPTNFNDFKIGYISDLNLNIKNDITKLESIVTEINKQNYHMVVFGGDLYDTTLFDQDEVSNLLKQIKTSHGKFAVLGEKDIAYDVSSILELGGFEVLHNTYRTIYYNDSSINLYGLEGTSDLTGIQSDEHKDHYSIALIHQPDYLDSLAKQSINLQLSGHSNGGYINIPFIGGTFKKDGATNYISGKHQVLDTTLLISNGLGNETTIGYRINNPCQILSITLKNK